MTSRTLRASLLHATLHLTLTAPPLLLFLSTSASATEASGPEVPPAAPAPFPLLAMWHNKMHTLSTCRPWS